MDKAPSEKEVEIVRLANLISLFFELDRLIQGYLQAYGNAPVSYLYLLELVVRQLSIKLDGNLSILNKIKGINTKLIFNASKEFAKEKCPKTIDKLLNKSKNTINKDKPPLDYYDQIIDKYLKKKQELKDKGKHGRRKKL